MFSIPGFPQLKRAESQFLSKHAALLDIALRIGDVLTIVVAALVIHRIELGHFEISVRYAYELIQTVLLAFVIFPAVGLYRGWRGERRLLEIARLWGAWAAVMVLLLVTTWALKSTGDHSRLAAGTWFAATGLMLTLERLVLRWVLRRVRARGLDVRRVMLVGGTQAGQRIVSATRKNAWMGLEVVGYISTLDDQVDIVGIPCLGSLDALAEQCRACALDQVWIALPMRSENIIKQVLQQTLDVPVTVRLVPDFFGYELINHHAALLGGVPVITLRGSRVEGHAGVAKAIEDRLLAIVLLILLAPLMVLLAVGVKLSSPGPVIYRQKRHGLGGKEFEVWKFRSMHVHAEQRGTVTQATRTDHRVTRFGRFLRSSSLDELPQLFNVLKGDMSVVGPRPHAVEHNKKFGERLNGYMQRNGVKPGITGLAQVKGFRGETDTLEKMSRRVECDIQYIKTWSVWLDLLILIRTPLAVLAGKGAY
jgi:Undecaprenyl-phosphate glucose phosphotransferase